MSGDGGLRGEGGTERGVLWQSPFDPAHERAQAQVATSVQVQFPSRLLLGEVPTKA